MRSLEALLELIQGGYRMPRPEHCPWELYTVMTECWSYQPCRRPSWSCLVSRLRSLYNSVLPGTYLELLASTVPNTPQSSPDNSQVPINIC